MKPVFAEVFLEKLFKPRNKWNLEIKTSGRYYGKVARMDEIKNTLRKLGIKWHHIKRQGYWAGWIRKDFDSLGFKLRRYKWPGKN